MAKPERAYPAIRRIEAYSGRSITIETQPTETLLSRCNAQEQSPLFTLPPELRNHIFELATLPYYDPNEKYRDTEFYYRPGHHARILASTALLKTCRRAWLEANHLPMQQATHCFWFQDPGRRPKYLDPIYRDESNRLNHFVNHMTPNNRPNLREIQIFAQLIWLEEHWPYTMGSVLGSAGVCPEVLIVTIKHSDWWFWESERQPRLDLERKGIWLKELLYWQAKPRLREIRLELETLESLASDVRDIVESIRSAFSTVRRSDSSGNPVSLQLREPPEWTWSGPTELGNFKHEIYDRLGKLDYRVFSLVWETTPESEEGRGTADAAKKSNVDPGPSNPGFRIENSDWLQSRAESSGRPQQHESNTASWIREWNETGSLLKFAPSR